MRGSNLGDFVIAYRVAQSAVPSASDAQARHFNWRRPATAVVANLRHETLGCNARLE
ncbi:MAG: hypothetical protein Udaeo2_12650 [Candidatus Udaeobacter sp.]|nr:MAG: hypothetical protein Udaeo2_12650 [Candidatus Udaeobacter sp.]